MRSLLNKLFATQARLIALIGICLFAQQAAAQIVYGVGGPNLAGGGLSNRFWIVSTAGVPSTPSVANTMAPLTESAAIGVSPLDGLVYAVERTVVTPRILTWNPQTGATNVVGNAGTPAGVGAFLRATFCPDGRFYIAGNGTAGGAGFEMYQINPSNAALSRTVVITNVPTAGSGDIVCVSNGDMYVVAQQTNPPSVPPLRYEMFRITSAQLAAPGNITITAVSSGVSNLTNTQAFNGLTELPNGNLMGSVALDQTAVYSITTNTFVATTLTTNEFTALADLSRSFPLGLSVSKTQTPTSLVQGTQTITYSLLVSNPGPAVAGQVTVTDVLSTAFQTVTWVCGVANAGVTTTVVTTACGAAAGTGNVNTTASLSINGAVRYTITAVLRATFTGTLTNVANGTVSTLLTVVTPTATISTVTATVQQAASLSVSKTNGVTTTVGGSTVNYTVTFSNFGPGAADGARIQDTPATGLTSCTVVSCATTGTPTAAVCPATGTASISPSSTTIPTFPPRSSVTLVVRCGVSATGL